MSEITRARRLYRRLVIWPLARILRKLGVVDTTWGLLQMQTKLELAPRRLLCFVARGHRWAEEPHHVTTSGPLHLPPGERDYEYLGSFRQCSRCYTTQSFQAQPDEVATELRVYREQAEQEWADPGIRAALGRLGDA